MADTMIQLVCAHCNKKFERRAADANRSLRLGKSSYCGLSCNAKARNKKRRGTGRKIYLDDSNLFWLAGLLEGEGSFLSPTPSEPYQPRISLQMCDQDIVKKVANLFGVIYIYHRVPPKKHHKESYKVIVKGYPAVNLMKQLKPLMGRRRQQQINKALTW